MWNKMGMIAIDPAIRREIAERVVEMSHPGYADQAQGAWYVVNGRGVQHRDATAPWNPWGDEDAVIRVDRLVREFGGPDARTATFAVAEDAEAEEAWRVAVDFVMDFIPEFYPDDDE